MNERQIFSDAVEIDDPQQRVTYLDKACGTDPALKERVLALLKSHDEAGSLLKVPAVAATTNMPELQEQIGSVIGPYKIREQIGEGGMGVVYVAEQTKPVRRKVALKIIKPGMDTKEVIARFEAERQALAMMDHPHIAKVFDANMTDTGRPYFVMELVQGLPITDYCDRHKLTTRERLELFILVCRAVQHAHQKAIIHRDLKPSNILVAEIDGAAVPKVIDFGVAKAIGHKLSEQTIYTQFSQLVGTPLYMSPEQAGLGVVDVDTRSDVYSLGVLLFELFTGSTPFDKETLKQAGFEEMRRIVREEEPPRPSARISTLKAEQLSTLSDQRGIDPRKYSHSLSGELDWIVMRALEKDRTRRYESASAFAADIERYLDDEPVEACPPSAVYRLKKLARRNKVIITTTTVVATAFILGIVGTSMQAARATKAERAANTERDAAQTQRDRAVDAEQLAGQRLDRVVKAEKVAETNFNKARETVDSMLDLVTESSLAGHPELASLRTELLHTSKQFYDDLIQLRPVDSMSYIRRGMAQEQLHHYEEALADLKQAVVLDPKNDFAHNALAQFLCCCQKTTLRDKSLAEKHAQKAVLLKPNNSDHWLRLGQVRNKLPNKRKLALEAYDRALELDSENVYALIWRSLFLPRDRAFEDLNKAISLSSNSTETAEAYRHIAHRYRDSEDDDFEKALENYALAEKSDRYNIYVFEERASLFKQLGDSEKSCQDLCRAIEVRPQRAFAYKRRAAIYFQRQQYDQALADIAQAVELLPDDTTNLTWISATLVARCPDEKCRKGLLELADRTVELTDGLPDAYVTRGYLKARLGNLDEALADYERGIEETKDPGTRAQHYNNAAWWIATSPQSTPRHIEKAVEWVEKAIELEESTNVPAALYQSSQPFNLMHFLPGADPFTARSLLYAVLKMNDRARADFEKAVSSESMSNYSRYHHALRRLSMDDLTAYRKGCRIMLEKSAETENSEEAYFTAWTCALTPNAIDDYSLAIELAERALNANPKLHSHQQCLGAVLYRDEKFDDAIEHLNKAVESENNAYSSPAYGLYFLAMAHHRLGNAGKAQEFLDRANQQTNRELNDAHSSASWNRRFTLDLLRKEAKALFGIEEAPMNSDKGQPPPPPLPEPKDN